MVRTPCRYTVRCRFLNGDQNLASKWLSWLRDGHIHAVLAAGAQSVEIIELDDSLPNFEIQYHFANQDRLNEYLQKHAPRLRAEGLAHFPLELGLEFTRFTGRVIYQNSTPAD